MKETYTVRVEGVKVWVEVVNCKAGYVATAMTGMPDCVPCPARQTETEISTTTDRHIYTHAGYLR